MRELEPEDLSASQVAALAFSHSSCRQSSYWRRCHSIQWVAGAENIAILLKEGEEATDPEAEEDIRGGVVIAVVMTDEIITAIIETATGAGDLDKIHHLNDSVEKKTTTTITTAIIIITNIINIGAAVLRAVMITIEDICNQRWQGGSHSQKNTNQPAFSSHYPNQERNNNQMSSRDLVVANQPYSWCSSFF